MALTHEDITELKRVFDDRYVQHSECDSNQGKIYGKLSNDDKRIEMLVLRQTINNWLTLAIAGGIVSLVIKVYLGC